MKNRLKAVALAAGAIATVGVGAGAIAATQGGGDPASDLASAINKQAGTNITSQDVQAAFKAMLKTRLDADVAAGRLTQAQADEMLANAGNRMPGFGPGGPGGPGHHLGGPPPVATAVAKLLGITEADLRTELQAGTTMTKLAATKSVSKADLVAAIQKALKDNKPAGAPALTDAQLKQMATSIADGTGGPRGHHRFGPPPAAPGSSGSAGSGTTTG